MTVSTFYPDADVETDTVDGWAEHVGDAVWDTIHDGAGTGSNDAHSVNFLDLCSTSTTNQWERMIRNFYLFDTSSIPDGDAIDSATFEQVFTASQDDFTSSISLVTTTPNANDDLVNGDYTQVGTTKQATDVTIAGLTVDSSTYNAMTLNATGLGNISKTGITKFGTRHLADLSDTEPTWASSSCSKASSASADEVLAGDKRPKLVVTHSIAFVPKIVCIS